MAFDQTGFTGRLATVALGPGWVFRRRTPFLRVGDNVAGKRCLVVGKVPAVFAGVGRQIPPGPNRAA